MEKHTQSLEYKMNKKYDNMANNNKKRGHDELPFTRGEWLLFWNEYRNLKIIVPTYNAHKAIGFKSKGGAVSVDRIDSTIDYTFNNIQFMTMAENAIKNHVIDNPDHVVKTLGHCLKLTCGDEVLYFESQAATSVYFNVSQFKIHNKLKYNKLLKHQRKSWTVNTISREEYEKSLT